MRKNINKKSNVTNETTNANQDINISTKNKVSNGFKTVEFFLKFIPIIVSIIALVLSFLSYNNSKENYFYTRVFQPLTYHYNFDTDNENTVKFGNYSMPAIQCSIKVNSGYIKKVMIISTDENRIESVYDYNSKLLESGLMNEMGIDFDLKFSTIVEFEDFIYQYIFVYVEGTNEEWNLDCIEIKYNETQTLDDISLLDCNDLLRNSIKNDEVTDLILTDYEMIFNNIKEINS
ncbi:MAG: hypothetical protein NC397_09790 [Clostridium sp.]|nr:hypothetical protein [Clostridium sp.]